MAVIQSPRPDQTQPTLVIEHKSVVDLATMWADLWAFRHLVIYLASRELKGRYRALSLGRAWFLIKPLSEMLVYVLIFGLVLNLHRGSLPYPVHVYTGLIAWLFFSNAATRVSSSFNAYRGMMTKVYFPRLVPPIVATVVEAADMGAAFLFGIVLMLVYGLVPGLMGADEHLAPNIGLLSLPLWLLLLLVWTAGVGLFAASMSVRHRDVGMIMSIVMRVWMYTAPVIYPISYIPERWLWLYRMNPVAVIVEGFRASLTGQALPPISAIAWTLLTGAGLLAYALVLYRRTERDIVDHF
ncbi:MAG TPA: ABC transporter permease [Geminicoccus sp.]|jgi:lipopolysaccharide transport system permease protein|uniref:ABC transporter permease n=1 Tax=Geminicoccus sp. TaxID=2024832 RepID=UPI002E36346C|nr:ABC transporter permease [Geminicoccus sp.]HEX2528337.1 ABC transporter permease [Geminicoccus sp.]